MNVNQVLFPTVNTLIFQHKNEFELFYWINKEFLNHQKLF